MTDIRRVIDDLGPTTLADLGLDSAINLLSRQFTTESLTVITRSEATPEKLPPAIESAVFWIATEALHNVSRHSHATRCEVSTVTASDTIRLTVSDDGTGITKPTGNGTGFASMRRRAEEVGGSFSVRSRHPAGTVLAAVLPLSTRRAQDGHG